MSLSSPTKFSKPLLQSFMKPIICMSFLLGVSLQTYAQESPNFPSGTANSTADFTLENGVAITPYQNSLVGSSLFLAAVNGTQAITTAVSTDGSTYEFPDINISDSQTGDVYHVNCNDAVPAACGIATAVYNGSLYMAFANQATGGLAVVEATPIPGNAGYTYTVAHRDNNVSLTSAPGMIVSNGNLIIIYGTSNYSVNGSYVTVLSGSTWTDEEQNSNAPTQPGLVNFNGTLYVITKQNNSDNGCFVAEANASTGVAISGSSKQIAGCFTGSGIAAAVFNNNIVFAIQSNASSHNLWAFSSPDGSTWHSTSYTNNQLGGPAGLAVFNNGLALAYKGNTTQTLFGTFATQ
jgi:hypothetical protein